MNATTNWIICAFALILIAWTQTYWSWITTYTFFNKETIKLRKQTAFNYTLTEVKMIDTIGVLIVRTEQETM